MHARKMLAKGFTLVEILIVVVILGILAAIVIPQFTNASEAAKFSSTVSQLQTIRAQLELYYNEHNDVYPDLATNWDQFTTVTELDGTAPESGDHEYGPYLQKVPTNPFTDSSTVSGSPTTDGTPSATVGWVWQGGLLKASISTAKLADVDGDATDFMAY